MNAPYQVMPPLSPEDYEALKADIAERGVLVPVEYDEHGIVLDGHHRVKACGELGITDWPRLIRRGLSDEGKRAHARALNLARRHLTQAQRQALVDAQLIDTPEQSDRSIAGKLGVSQPTVSARRKELEAEGMVIKVITTTGKDGIEQPREKRIREKPLQSTFLSEIDQRRAFALPEPQRIAVVNGVVPLQQAITQTRREQRIDALAAIAQGNAPLDGVAERYPVLYVDPPWRYEHVKTESRAIENQYPTMSLEEIKALPVSDIAFDDCVLFMWATSPKLAEAFDVLTAWGFAYRTCAVWDKQKIGMGYYVRQQHEHLLIATLGNPPAPAPENRKPSVYSEPRGPHSAKPLYYYQMIESMYPGVPKLELFARTPHDGWAAWGNEAKKYAGASS